MDKSFLVVITGASRGFGRAVALSLAKNAASIPVHFRLTASTASTPLLTSLSDQIKDIRKTNETIIECMTADLSDMAAVSNISSFLFTKPISEMTYSHLIFINNHGSLGELSLVGTHDAAKMQSAFTVNITSSCFLSSESIRHSKTYPGINVRIVNVSSLCAIQPFQSWGEYCAGKAARDMYHRVIAEEYKDTNIRTFNWAPGPLDTDMQKEIREGENVHEETKLTFVDMKQKGILVAPEVSADKCVKVLLLDKFESGAHLDFYDTTEDI